jgi:hypothetical protein
MTAERVTIVDDGGDHLVVEGLPGPDDERQAAVVVDVGGGVTIAVTRAGFEIAGLPGPDGSEVDDGA